MSASCAPPSRSNALKLLDDQPAQPHLACGDRACRHARFQLSRVFLRELVENGARRLSVHDAGLRLPQRVAHLHDDGFAFEGLRSLGLDGVEYEVEHGEPLVERGLLGAFDHVVLSTSR